MPASSLCGRVVRGPRPAAAATHRGHFHRSGTEPKRDRSAKKLRKPSNAIMIMPAALPWPYYQPSTHVRSTKTRHAPRTPSARAPLSRTRRSHTPSSSSSTTRRNAQHLVQQKIATASHAGGGDAVRDDDARHLTTPSTTISVNNAITITELPGSTFLSNVIDKHHTLATGGGARGQGGGARGRGGVRRRRAETGRARGAGGRASEWASERASTKSRQTPQGP